MDGRGVDEARSAADDKKRKCQTGSHGEKHEITPKGKAVLLQEIKVHYTEKTAAQKGCVP
jgi:hypothetical protein